MARMKKTPINGKATACHPYGRPRKSSGGRAPRKPSGPRLNQDTALVQAIYGIKWNPQEHEVQIFAKRAKYDNSYWFTLSEILGKNGAVPDCIRNLAHYMEDRFRDNAPPSPAADDAELEEQSDEEWHENPDEGVHQVEDLLGILVWNGVSPSQQPRLVTLNYLVRWDGVDPETGARWPIEFSPAEDVQGCVDILAEFADVEEYLRGAHANILGQVMTMK